MPEHTLPQETARPGSRQGERVRRPGTKRVGRPGTRFKATCRQLVELALEILEELE